MLHKSNQDKKEANGKMLMTIIEIVQFLGRQGFAFRGHDNLDSNFMQLVKLRSHDDNVKVALICVSE